MKPDSKVEIKVSGFKLSNEGKNLLIIGLAVLVIALLSYIWVGSKVASSAGSNPSSVKVSGAPLSGVSEGGLSSYSHGPESAKVTVVEFLDPECETCAMINPYIQNEIKYYEGRVRWIFRYMAYHPNSRNAIKVMEAARKQGLYSEAKVLLFERQKEWGSKHDGRDEDQTQKILSIVGSVPGIDLKKLKEDMNDPAIPVLIENDIKEGTLAGVKGTPTLFVNGKMIDPLSLDKMIEWIDQGLK